MKTFTVELEVGTKKAIKNIGDLEDEIEKLSNELKGADFGSAEFKRLSNELIKAQKQIKNTELSLESLDSEQVASEFGSVVGAVGDMTGAMVLLGGTGGAVEETAENIEKAIGISMAFKGAIEGVSSGMKLFNNIVKTNTLLQKANNTITLIASAVMKTLTGSVNTTSAAFKGLRGAMIATGIGALVVAVGLLIANFDKLKAAITGISEAQRDRVDSSEKLVSAAEREAELGALQINNMKLQGATEEEIVKFRMKALQKQLDAQIALITAQEELNASQLEGTTSWNESLQDVIEIYLYWVAGVPRLIALGIEEASNLINYLFEQLQSTKAGRIIFGDEKIDLKIKPSTALEDFIGDATEYVAGLVFDPEATKEEGEKTLSEARLKAEQMKSDLAGLQLDLNNIEAQGIKDRKATRDKAAEEEQKDRERELQEYNDFLAKKEELENLYFDSKLSKEQQEINAVQDKYFTLLEEAKKYGEDVTVIEEAQAAEIDAVKKKYADIEIQRERATQDMKFEIASSALNSINELANIFAEKDEESAKKAFNINKAVGIAQTGINTAQAIMKTAAETTDPTPMQALRVANMVAMGVAGAVQIAAIASQKFQPTGTGGGSVTTPSIGTGVGAGSQAPSFNVVGQNGFNQIASAIGQQPPVQAFVVAQDVTTAQQLQNNTIQTATF